MITGFLFFYNLLFLPALFLLVICGIFYSRLRVWIYSSLLTPNAFAQRFGFAGANSLAQVWIHSASLGETMALAEFLRLLRRSHPSLKIHMTCMTPAGRNAAQKHYLGRELIDSVSLMPVDFWPVLSAYMSRMPHLRALFIVETEIWPNLIRMAYGRGLRLAWINARVTQKSVQWFGFVSAFARETLNCFDMIAAGSQSTQTILLELGIKPDKISLSGNLKWDFKAPPNTLEKAHAGRLRAALGLADTAFFFAAASTRPGEEAIILEACRKMAAKHSAFRAALAPRHPERVDEIKKIAASLGFFHVSYSQILESNSSGLSPARTPAQMPQLILVDCFGALLNLYGAADAVFVGGTLIDGYGGHNFLEPAAYAKPLAVGPYFANFSDIASVFKSKQAIQIVKNTSDLEILLDSWIKDAVWRAACGQHALNAFAGSQGASQKTWELIQPLVAI